MKKKVLDNKYLTIYFDDEKSFMEAICNEKSKEFSDDDYRKTAMQYADTALQYKPELILVDHTNFFYTITPSMQEWINQNILPKLFKAGVHKLAIVKSPYIFTEISVEQIITQANSDPIKKKLFNNKDEALQWLFE